ncbi:MAG: hypothetical protein ACE5DT_07785 [Nitrosopumilus sp.]
MEQTSIALSKDLKARLDNHKNHPRESYETTIVRLLEYLYEENERLDRNDLKEIKKAMEDFEKGKFTTNKQLRKELKL